MRVTGSGVERPNGSNDITAAAAIRIDSSARAFDNFSLLFPVQVAGTLPVTTMPLRAV